MKKKIIKKIQQFSTPPQDTYTKEPYSLPLRREPDPTRIPKNDHTCVPDMLPPLPCPSPRAPRPQNKLLFQKLLKSESIKKKATGKGGTAKK